MQLMSVNLASTLRAMPTTRNQCAQELKSRQQGLPEAVAAVVKEHWMQCYSFVKANSSEPTRDATAWNVPGLTITSFHFDQLLRSKQVRCLPYCSAWYCVLFSA